MFFSFYKCEITVVVMEVLKQMLNKRKVINHGVSRYTTKYLKLHPYYYYHHHHHHRCRRLRRRRRRRHRYTSYG